MIDKTAAIGVVKKVIDDQYKLPHKPEVLEVMQYVADQIAQRLEDIPESEGIEPGDYWGNVTNIYKKQIIKGINTYGQRLEQNQLPEVLERITYQQEELIDALVYCEWIKDGIKHMEVEKNG